MGGGRNLERLNVELPIFRNSEIANSKIRKNELFDFLFFYLFFNFLILFEHPEYLIIFQIEQFPKFDHFLRSSIIDIFEILKIGKLKKFQNFLNLENSKFQKMTNFRRISKIRSFLDLVNCRPFSNFTNCKINIFKKKIEFGKLELYNFKNSLIFHFERFPKLNYFWSS